MQILNYSSSVATHFPARVHTLVKMLVVFVCSILCLLLESPSALTLLVGVSLIPIVQMKRLPMVTFIYVILAIFYGISLIFMEIIGIYVPMMANRDRLAMLVPFLRIAMMLNVILTLVLSSSVKRFTSTLKTLRLPLVLFLPLVVVFRFIPTFINDCRQISESMRIRGVRLNPLNWIRRPLLMIRMLIVPAVIRALSCAEDLALSADWKGVGEGQAKRITHRNPERFSQADTWFLTTALLSIAVAIFLNIQFPGGSIYEGGHGRGGKRPVHSNQSQDRPTTDVANSPAETAHPAEGAAKAPQSQPREASSETGEAL